MAAILIFAALLFAPTVLSEEVCYSPFGCYNLDSPWKDAKRPYAVLPESPDDINTKFILYTKFQTEGKELKINDSDSIDHSGFSSSINTRIYIHGFMKNGNEDVAMKLKDELQKYESSNIIFVNWGAGASSSYKQTAANARLVADQLAQLLTYIQKRESYLLSKVHLIGEGVGAHLAGFVGKKLKGLGRITALDATDPYFNGPETARLQKNDAHYVDAIHTDGSNGHHLGYGTDIYLGHADFFPNDGNNQPGCGHGHLVSGESWDTSRVEMLGEDQALSCDHQRAVELFTESINTKCPFVAFRCRDVNEFENGLCNYCAHNNNCSRFGFHSDKHMIPGHFYFRTDDKAPFCEHSLLVDLFTTVSQPYTVGRILVMISGTGKSTKFFRINNYNRGNIISKNAIYSRVIEWKPDMGTIKSADVLYFDESSFYKETAHVGRIDGYLFDVDIKPEKYTMCGIGQAVHDKETVRFNLTLAEKC